jgi:hypothetical protein
MSAFFFAFLFPSLSFHLTVMFTSMLYSVFVLSRLFFSFTRGASSPKWVKPAAEGGGLSGICFLFACFFRNLQFRYMFAFVFVYIAIMAEERETRLN